MLPRLPYFFVSRSLGLLLFMAAAFKFKGLAAEPVGPAGMLSSPAFQTSLMLFEVILALWLIWGRYPIGSWISAVFAFFVFALVNIYQGWNGQISCRCFGTLSVHPWYAFGVDLATLMALISGRPKITELTGILRIDWARLAVASSFFLVGVASFLGLFALAAWYLFGSPEAALAYFRDEHISVKPNLVDLRYGEPGEVRITTIELVNRTDHPIRIIGGTSDCSCMTTADLPLTVQGLTTRKIALRITFPVDQGEFTRKASLIMDEDQFQIIVFRLTGKTSKSIK